MIYVFLLLLLSGIFVFFWYYTYRAKPVLYYSDFLKTLSTAHKIMENRRPYLFSEPVDDEDKKIYGVGAEKVLMSQEEIQSSYYGVIVFRDLTMSQSEYDHILYPSEVKIKGKGKISFGRDDREVLKNIETLAYLKRGNKGWKLVYFGMDIE